MSRDKKHTKPLTYAFIYCVILTTIVLVNLLFGLVFGECLFITDVQTWFVATTSVVFVNWAAYSMSTSSWYFFRIVSPASILLFAVIRLTCWAIDFVHPHPEYLNAIQWSYLISWAVSTIMRFIFKKSKED